MRAIMETAQQNLGVLQTLKVHIGMGLQSEQTEDNSMELQIRIAEIDAEFKEMLVKYPPIQWMPSMKKKPNDSWMKKPACNSSSATSEMVSSRESKPNPDSTIYTPSWTD